MHKILNTKIEVAEPEGLFHALLCDPPYHLHGGNPNAKTGFMGKAFDGGDIAFRSETWAKLAKHLYPGAFGMAFASSRGWHRLAVAIEDAGLIIHPSIFGWSFGSGFPKATRIDTQVDKTDARDEKRARQYQFTTWFRDAIPLTNKQIDELCGTNTMARHWTDVPPNGQQPDIPTAEYFDLLRPHLPEPPEWVERYVEQRTIESKQYAEREVIGERKQRANRQSSLVPLNVSAGYTEILTQPATPLAKSWEGHRYGLQALKPALEPIIVFQKPYEGKPIDCITQTGAGALNIDKSRIRTTEIKEATVEEGGKYAMWNQDGDNKGFTRHNGDGTSNPKGRWASNLVLHHTPECNGNCIPECPVARMDEQSGALTSGSNCIRQREGYFGAGDAKNGGLGNQGDLQTTYGDTGTASRFFYQVQTQINESDPVKYCAKASRDERDSGLDRYVTVKYNVDDISKEISTLWHDANTELAVLLKKVMFEAGLDANLSIAVSGENITVLCHRGFLSTIKITISKITESKILNWLTHSRINDCIVGANSETINGGNRAVSAAHLNQLRKNTGISASKDTRLTTDAAPAIFGLLLKISKNEDWQSARSTHPTHKPIDLTKYLATLLLPPDDYAPRRILIPFSGAGSEMIGACLAEWEEVVGIEMDAEYCEIAEKRLKFWNRQPKLF